MSTMNLIAQGTLDGNYEVSNPIELANSKYVIGHEFAPHKDWAGMVNVDLAEYISLHYAHKRVYAAKAIADVLHEIAPDVEVAGVLGPDGISSKTFATEGGSWGELQQAKLLAGEDMQRPILVAQAFHVGRVALQAKKAGLDPLLPPGLPRRFDPNSKQWWCRSPRLWPIREIPGALELRRRGQL